MNLDWHYKLRGNENGTIEATASRSEGRDGCTPYDPDEENTGEAGHPAHASTCTGWVPVGTSTEKFTGHLNGAGNRIINLYAKASGRSGLFAYTNGATIQNLGLSAVKIRGGDYVGALAGDMMGGRVANSYATGDVEGGSSSDIGGLVGNNSGSISNSYATASATGGSSSRVGGLVGDNSGSISNSYATASATGGDASRVGGLVGNNSGRISNSYATASATGRDLAPYVGGLVGINSGRISNSYATGDVEGGSFSYIGGLGGGMGDNSGRISNSYATGDVEGGSSSKVGGLLGDHGGTISNSYATGSVSGGDAGGLVGESLRGSSISGKNYFVSSVDSNGGMDGIGSGNSCPSDKCIQATDPAGDATRITWLQDTFDERTVNTARPAGLGWSEMNWEGFVGAGVGYPKLLYAQVEGYCSASPTTLTTPELCLAAGSCRAGGHADRTTCEGADETWMPTNTWLAGGDECGGSTGVVCGARIAGQ